MRAYPDVPEHVKEMVARSEQQEDSEGPTFYDSCQDALYTLHRVMAIAAEEGETWLVELLELEREGLSAQAAYALRDHRREREGAIRPAE